MPTGAELLVRLLRDHDVEVCFGLPGVHNLALWEALRDSPIRLVGVRHEQAAALRRRRVRACDRPARRGAHDDRAGRGEHARRRRRGVGLAVAGAGDRHGHPVGAAQARDLPRRAARDDRPGGDVRAGDEGDAPRAGRRRGRRRGRGRRGRGAWRSRARPVYLEIATDLLGAEVPDAAGEAPAAPAAAANGGLDEAVARLAAAERPLLWVGGGARDARGAGRAAWPSSSPRRC